MIKTISDGWDIEYWIRYLFSIVSVSRELLGWNSSSIDIANIAVTR